jgi:hypothetical protein
MLQSGMRIMKEMPLGSTLGIGKLLENRREDVAFLI